MEATSDSRFDPNFAFQLLLDIVHEHSLDTLLQKFVRRMVERPLIAACHVWMIEQGDLCARCPCRSECPDQSRCLHLVAAKENSIIPEAGKGLRRPEAVPKRVPLGTGLMGKAVASGQEVYRALHK